MRWSGDLLWYLEAHCPELPGACCLPVGPQGHRVLLGLPSYPGCRHCYCIVWCPQSVGTGKLVYEIFFESLRP